ncbi:hypothetical protein GX408_17800 [bacterium]|nr:hypothetical protein [bacterium]
MRKGFFLITGLLALCACSLDQGLQPTRSGFSGTIRFKNAWPEQTDQVLVVAATQFPPSAITDIVMSDPLPLHRDSVEYTLFTTPQSFAAVGVVWKEKKQPWDVTNLIGLYFDGDNPFNPGKVHVRSRDQLVENINIEADLSKAKRKVASGIDGLLRIHGAWPAASQSLLMVASQPIVPFGLLDVSLGQPMEVPFDSSRFFLNLQPGTYRLVGALLIEKGVDIGLTSVVGLYYKKAGDLFPGAITIANDSTIIRGVTIHIDFNKRPFAG